MVFKFCPENGTSGKQPFCHDSIPPWSFRIPNPSTHDFTQLVKRVLLGVLNIHEQSAQQAVWTSRRSDTPTCRRGRNHYTSTSLRVLSVSVKEILASTARHHGVCVSPYAAIRSQQPVVTWPLGCVVDGQMQRFPSFNLQWVSTVSKAFPTCFVVPRSVTSNRLPGEKPRWRLKQSSK